MAAIWRLFSILKMCYPLFSFHVNRFWWFFQLFGIFRGQTFRIWYEKIRKIRIFPNKSRSFRKFFIFDNLWNVVYLLLHLGVIFMANLILYYYRKLSWQHFGILFCKFGSILPKIHLFEWQRYGQKNVMTGVYSWMQLYYFQWVSDLSFMKYQPKSFQWCCNRNIWHEYFLVGTV